MVLVELQHKMEERTLGWDRAPYMALGRRGRVEGSQGRVPVPVLVNPIGQVSHQEYAGVQDVSLPREDVEVGHRLELHHYPQHHQHPNSCPHSHSPSLAVHGGSVQHAHDGGAENWAGSRT
jgi:hypothetical protein